MPDALRLGQIEQRTRHNVPTSIGLRYSNVGVMICLPAFRLRGQFFQIRIAARPRRCVPRPATAARSRPTGATRRSPLGPGFGLAVEVGRRGRVVFVVDPLGAVEHRVGRGEHSRARCRAHSRATLTAPVKVDPLGQLLLALAAVDIRQRRQVRHHVGPCPIERRAHAGRVGNVDGDGTLGLRRMARRLKTSNASRAAITQREPMKPVAPMTNSRGFNRMPPVRFRGWPRQLVVWVPRDKRARWASTSITLRTLLAATPISILGGY